MLGPVACVLIAVAGSDFWLASYGKIAKQTTPARPLALSKLSFKRAADLKRWKIIRKQWTFMPAKLLLK